MKIWENPERILDKISSTFDPSLAAVYAGAHEIQISIQYMDNRTLFFAYIILLFLL